jgi:hypothetical protein
MTGTRPSWHGIPKRPSSPFARGIATGLLPHSYKAIWIKELHLSALVHVLMSYPTGSTLSPIVETVPNRVHSCVTGAMMRVYGED